MTERIEAALRFVTEPVADFERLGKIWSVKICRFFTERCCCIALCIYF